jgi:protein disulfide-isomerase
MRSLSLLGFLLLISVRVSAVQIGDTLDKVTAEKGKPAGEMNAGTTQILNYADQTIKLKNGKVVEVSKVERPAAPAAPVPSGETAPSDAVGGAPSGLAPTVTAKSGKEAIKTGSWTTDVRAAIAQAKVQHRRVFLLFTASDWSAFSQRFYKEVLSTPEFGRYATEKLILVMLDFPKGIAQNQALKDQNQTLLKALKIERFPTVVLLNSDGKTLGMLPYEEGGPVKFIDSMKKL